MERHIGLWRKEGANDPAVAELIIDGNQIEFYSRAYGEVFPCAFIGSDNDHKYKVFVNGSSKYGKHRTLENVVSYKTYYVLQQNCKYKAGMSIEGITTCSFVIPELIDWIDLKTVKWGTTENEEMIAAETKISEIVLKKENPSIQIYFEPNCSLFDPNVDDRTTFVIENRPRIRISYKEPIEFSQLHNDIRGIMQFFGLMIGHVTDAIDIRLDIKEQELKSRLYINEDFSYNVRTLGSMDRLRTRLSKIQDNINNYFEGWYDFYNDHKFELIRRMYFMGNRRKDIYAEDILVQYVKILEGYHLRITDEEQVASTIEKDIKNMIVTDEGKVLFTPIFEKAGWKFNAKHSKAVASWIAGGFLGKVGLAERLKLLDDKYFNIIANNAVYITKLDRRESVLETAESEQDIKVKFYRNIVATRNYYSHYKLNKDNVLNFTQMCNTINVLKALIIMILYSHMGMELEDARKIVIWDSELDFQTMWLRREGGIPDNT
ncbi:HEPN domain-containing protein [Clostridium sporogenes]